MIRVLFVLGLVACDRQARQEAPRVVVAPRAIARASPPAPTLPARVVDIDVDRCPNVPDDAEGLDDIDSCPDVVAVHGGHATDDTAIAAAHVTDDKAIAAADTASHGKLIAGTDKPSAADDSTTDQDFDDIPDELDKCPDVPEDVDGSEDIDGCPEAVKI